MPRHASGSDVTLKILTVANGTITSTSAVKYALCFGLKNSADAACPANVASEKS